MNNWFDHILYHTGTQPDAPAIIMEDRVVTYGMLKVGIDRCASRIKGLKIAGGQPVAVMLENPARHITVCLALFRLGILSVSLPSSQFSVAGIEFAAAFGDAAAKGVIGSGDRFFEITDSWFTSDPEAHNFGPGFTASSQICRMNLTSGTTGDPKIVALTIEDIGHRMGPLVHLVWDRLLCNLGPSSSWGFWTACATLAVGRTVCFSASPFQSIRMIELFSIDYLMAATEQLVALTRVARTSRANLTSLRMVETAGGIVTRALLESAMIYLCKNIYCRYGASETGAMARAPAREVLSRPGFAGHVLPGVEIAVFDKAGKQCASDEIGRVKCRRDPRWDNPSLDGQKLKDRDWIDLGDSGWMTADGGLYILGRASEAQLRTPDLGARQISPVHEIEQLFRLEWDATDAAAVVFDEVADPTKPQIWIGVVDCKDADTRKFESILHDKGIKCTLRLISMAFIPRGVNGKVNRSNLRSAMLAVASNPHSPS